MQYTTYYHSKRPSPSGPPRTSQNKKPRRRLRRSLIAIGAIGLSALVLGSGLPHANHASAAPAKQYAKSQTVCLDPGHGGSDPGALSSDGSISERDINLIVADRVETNLENKGYQVFMTRTSNVPTLSNHDRYTYCNKMHATILLSIHHNFYSDSSVDYSAALFYKDQDQTLATSVLNSVATDLNLQNDNISQFDDGVLSESNMPAALSEGLFISSDAEYSLLTATGSTRLKKEADAITKGIINYFTKPSSQQSVINKNPQQIERNDGGA